MFDRSVSLAEHLLSFLPTARHCFSRLSRAILALFGIFLANAAPTGIQAARRGKQPVTKEIEMSEQAMKTTLLVDPKEAARMLAVSTRKLWGMTFEDEPGLPFVRCGRLVRYPVADLQGWIESQRKGGNHA